MKRVAPKTLLRSFLSLKSSNSISFVHPHGLSLYYLSNLAGNNNGKDDKEWNDAWETAWLPDDNITGAPWESDLNLDSDTKAFVEDMNNNWHHRRNNNNHNNCTSLNSNLQDSGFSSFENDYRLKKQRIHAGLWTKQIHLLQESKLGGGGDDIDNLLHSCSEIFESAANDPKVPNSSSSSSSELKNKPDGWETTSKSEDANVWEMSQREEDVLLQEFERRLAFCKFQIASFIKTHIFSRRRPIDGWKYMIEVIGPNARKGKGSVSRIPGLADPATQPFAEERTSVSGGRLTSRKTR